MPSAHAHEPRHGAIVLAAGTSSRLGRAKQLIEIDCEPLLRRVARYALATNPLEAIVVLSRSARDIEAALDGIDTRMIRIDDAHEGMSASLRAGVAALDARCDGALVVLTDQPALRAEHLEQLCLAWRRAPMRAVASEYANVIGTPALLPRGWFDAIRSLTGDIGARSLLRERIDETTLISVPELARDIDTPLDLAKEIARRSRTE